MVQTDPLSLVFIGCFVFSGAFLLATTLLGSSHSLHLHTGHVHLGAHMGHGGHIGHTTHTATINHGSATQQAVRVALPHASTSATPATPAPAISPIMRTLGNLNINEVLVFLFSFGLLGYTLHNLTSVGAVLTIIASALLGTGAAAGVNVLFLRMFGEETGRLGIDSSQMEGRLATVSLPIRANGVGEIIFLGENGTRRSLGARSTDGSAIARDADVVIMEYTDGIAKVQAWENFITDAQTPATQ